MREPLHGIHALLAQGGHTTALQAIANDVEINLLFYVLGVYHL
jgi:hypothetical protein